MNMAVSCKLPLLGGDVLHKWRFRRKTTKAVCSRHA